MGVNCKSLDGAKEAKACFLAVCSDFPYKIELGEGGFILDILVTFHTNRD